MCFHTLGGLKARRPPTVDRVCGQRAETVTKRAGETNGKPKVHNKHRWKLGFPKLSPTTGPETSKIGNGRRIYGNGRVLRWLVIHKPVPRRKSSRWVIWIHMSYTWLVVCQKRPTNGGKKRSIP